MGRSKGKAICFVVSLVLDGKKYYLEREQVGILDSKTMKPIREPQGFFTQSILDCAKWLDEDLAKAVCAGYEGAQVEVIKEGEVLK